MKDGADIIAYKLGEKLYLNITNKCSNRCSFCIRNRNKGIGYNLWLQKEPDVQEIIAAVDKAEEFDEIVFCGYGEPLCRPDTVVAVAKILKNKYPVRIRINTNGQADLINNSNIAPQLKGFIDCVSISLNADTREKYNKICCPDDPENAYQAVLDFALQCKKYVAEVVLSVVDTGEISVSECYKTADLLGIPLKVRKYQAS